jgi:hypothetical protein
MVWAIERPRIPQSGQPPPHGADQTAATKVDLQLVIESTYQVDVWTVQVLGADQPATRSDRTSWSGKVHLAKDDEVFIQAAAKPDSADSGVASPRCLRIRLGSAPDRFMWGSGDVTATAGLAP